MIWIILGWLLCGFIHLGIWVAYCQNEYAIIAEEDYRKDLFVGIFLSIIAAPLVLIIMFFWTGFVKYGWSLKPYNIDNKRIGGTNERKDS